MFLLGQLIDLFWGQIPSLRNMYKKANEQFSFKKYWSSDWNIICGSLVVGIMLIIGLDQLLAWKPEVVDKIKWLFACIGAMCSTLAGRWSRSKKYILSIIDKKTNIADNISDSNG